MDYPRSWRRCRNKMKKAFSNLSSGPSCPCPWLTAYWTPPPSCARQIFCDSPQNFCSYSFFGYRLICKSKHICIFLGVVILTYYITMDVIFFTRFRMIDIVKDNIPGGDDEMYSPFTHLGVKSLMNDHTSQYIISPSTEYFDQLTNFSSTFSCITPNMISFTHLFIAFVSGKFVASETLADRRIGVVLFQIRNWLDSFDGVVYRSQSKSRLQYRSIRDNWGFIIDTWSDLLAGFFLSFGVLFYLFKRFDRNKHDLPVVQMDKGGFREDVQVTYSKRYLFWKVFCYGFCLAWSGKCWDLTVGGFRDTLQVPMKDETISARQFELCHSFPTLLIFYLWRLLEGQALLQYFLIPIYLDKVWEFLNYTQYILFCIIFSLCVVSFLYVKHLRITLGIDGQ